MKISELEYILKEYREKYGDIDVRLYDTEFDFDHDLSRNNITASSHDEDNPTRIEYITIWC